MKKTLWRLQGSYKFWCQEPGIRTEYDLKKKDSPVAPITQEIKEFWELHDRN